jgi:hypothetical protein
LVEKVVTFFRLMLRDGSSVEVDAIQARRLIRAGKVISVKEIGRNSPLYQRRVMRPDANLNAVGYYTK